MFDLRTFILNGLLRAVGEMADWKIILNATGWYEKDVLTLADLEVINEAIDKLHPIEEEPTEEEVVENE